MSKWNRSLGSDTYDGVKPLTTEMGKAYRPSTHKWSVPYEEWRDDASCNGLPIEHFVLADGAVTDEHHELIAEGLKVCSGCPVRAACKTNSNEEDRYWSIRGGQPPEGLFPEVKIPKFTLTKIPMGHKKGEGPERKLKEKCNYGHDDWVIDGSGKRRCQTCRKRTANAARKKRSGRKDVDWSGKAV